MARPSNVRLAQVAIGVLLLVIVRSLGEYFRLQYLHGDALLVDQVTPFVAGALFATVTLALTMVCYVFRFYRIAICLTAATLIVLATYKVAVVG